MRDGVFKKHQELSVTLLVCTSRHHHLIEHCCREECLQFAKYVDHFVPLVMTLVINAGRSSSRDMLSLEWSEGNDKLQSDDGGVFGLLTGLELFDEELPSSLW